MVGHRIDRLIGRGFPQRLLGHAEVNLLRFGFRLGLKGGNPRIDGFAVTVELAQLSFVILYA